MRWQHRPLDPRLRGLWHLWALHDLPEILLLLHMRQDITAARCRHGGVGSSNCGVAEVEVNLQRVDTRRGPVRSKLGCCRRPAFPALTTEQLYKIDLCGLARSNA